MRGRKPKPTSLRLIQGNAGHRPINVDEPIAPPTLPDPPAHLGSAALAEWNRVGPIMRDAGLLSNMDMQTFAAYCEAVGEVSETAAAIRKYGSVIRASTGFFSMSPYWIQHRAAVKVMLSFAAEFGLTPSSRSRIKVDQKEPDDEFERYMKNGPATPSR